MRPSTPGRPATASSGRSWRRTWWRPGWRSARWSPCRPRSNAGWPPPARAATAAQRARLAVVRLEAEYARRETERYRQLNAELAEANRRLKEQALLMDRVSREDEL